MFRNWIRRLKTPSSAGTVMVRRPRLSLLALEDRVVPALLYVDPDFVGTPGTTVTFNAGEAGQVDGLTLGTNAFTDIETAITASVAGDTIFLGEATHVTNVDILIDKSISLVGSGIGATAVTPNSSTDPLNDQFSWFVVTGGATVNFSQTTFNGASPDFEVNEAIRFSGANGVADTVSFINISRPAVEFDGVGVAVTNPGSGSNVTVSNTFFNNMGRAGIIFQDAGTVGTVSNIIYTGKGIGNFVDIGVEVSFGASALVTGSTFSNNLGVAEDSSASSAIQVTGPGSTLTAFGNLITNNQVGLLVGIDQDLDGDGVATDLDTPVVIANFNNIFGNNVGIASNVSSTTPVDATQNFFGTFDGPQSDAFNPSGTGNLINDVAGATNIGPFLRQITPVVPAGSGTSYISTITPPDVYAVGAGAGGGPRVDVFQNGTLIGSFFAYDLNFTGGVRVATGDVDGDGVIDIITTPGAGGGPHVRVFDRAGNEKASFLAFVPNFTGGVFVAVGDTNGDNVDEIIVGAGAGGGPNVKVFTGAGSELLSFFAYTEGYTGGVTVDAGDMDFDLIDEIITGALSNATHVKTFDGVSAVELSSFFAFEGAATGVFVSSGDTNGDGFEETFAGLTTAIGQVGVFSTQGNRLNSFLVDSTGGVRVAGVDLPGEGPELLAVASGLGRPTSLSFLDPLTGTTVLTDDPFLTIVPGGVFVG